MSALPNIKVFVDCADYDSISAALRLPYIKGFTTNPSLVSQAGVTDYTTYARSVLTLSPSLPVSFEVLSEYPDAMAAEARVIRSWGENVYAKVPVIDSSGTSMGPLIRELSGEGVPLNVTCVFTPEQARIAAESLDPHTPSIVSVFAGRIADVGVDPLPIVTACAKLLAPLPKTELLWASTREVFNIWQAAAAGCAIVTAPLGLVRKLDDAGKDLTELSRDAVAAFMRDIASSGVRFGETRS